MMIHPQNNGDVDLNHQNFGYLRDATSYNERWHFCLKWCVTY